MYKFILCLSCLIFSSGVANADSGLVSIKSAYSVAETADRLEAKLQEKGMTVFIRINHAAGAKKVGKTLRPTEVIIFGNPKIGTSLMQCEQTVAIDLPQKALIRQDDAGQVWLSYNDPQYLAERHSITGCDEVVQKIGKALNSFAQSAAIAETKE